MASTAARARRTLNVWPGYVDALATLLLSVVFLLTVFVVGQFFLSQELTGRDETLAKLNRQIADLTDLLALERSNRRNQEEEVRNPADPIRRPQTSGPSRLATVTQRSRYAQPHGTGPRTHRSMFGVDSSARLIRGASTLQPGSRRPMRWPTSH